ncbi:MAG: hypothetical protein GWP08_08340 [Nitrospiraceae bacterium]|nr:hypothetical protein [Nitrospiraceae bacterium]
MQRLKLIAGIIALAGLAIGLNLVVLNQNPFAPVVLLALGVGAGAGVAWVALVFYGMSRHSPLEGKALYGLNTVVTTVLFLGICIVIYAFAEHGGYSWDLTKEGRRQLAPQTVQVLENLDKDVEVIAFFLQIDDELVRIAEKKTKRFLEQCQSHTPRLKVNFLDPQLDRLQLEELGITHASTQGTIVIRCGGSQKVITLSGASPRLEERDFTNAVVNLVRSAHPKVCFLTGHGERSIDDPNESAGGSTLKALLEGEAYRVERIGIRITRPEIPADCDILVINGLAVSGPRGDLHPEEIRAIQEYLDRGGRLLIMLDPLGRVSRAPNQVDQLLPWLAMRYGVVVGQNIAVSPEAGWTLDLTTDTSVFPGQDPNDPFRACYNQTHRITVDSDQHMLFSVARSVGLAETMPARTVGSELLRSTPDFYGETDIETLKTTGEAFKTPEELAGPLPLAVAVTAKTEELVGDTGMTRDARIVVVGDSDFASNAQLTVVPGNLNFVLNVFAWLSENEELIAIRPSGKQDAPVILSEGDRRAIVYITVLGTSQAVALAGFVAYLLRRKHR